MLAVDESTKNNPIFSLKFHILYQITDKGVHIIILLIIRYPIARLIFSRN
jgi:hypothetical protein